MAKAKLNRVQFVRDHVEAKLVQHGFTEEKACDLVSHVSDAEIEATMPKETMKGLFDGKVLTWLSEHKTEILDAAEKIFNLLALIK